MTGTVAEITCVEYMLHLQQTFRDLQRRQCPEHFQRRVKDKGEDHLFEHAGSKAQAQHGAQSERTLKGPHRGMGGGQDKEP